VNKASSPWSWALAISLVLLPNAPMIVGAQETTLAKSTLEPSRNPAVIAGQLRLAAELGRKALSGFQAAPTDDSVPLDENILRAARNTYVLIRAARAGLEHTIERQKYPDPVIDLVFKRVDKAWNLSRTPVDKITWGIPRQEYLTISVRDLDQALRLVDQALVLLP
jgi:hypothetical protein